MDFIEEYREKYIWIEETPREKLDWKELVNRSGVFCRKFDDFREYKNCDVSIRDLTEAYRRSNDVPAKELILQIIENCGNDCGKATALRLRLEERIDAIQIDSQSNQ